MVPVKRKSTIQSRTCANLYRGFTFKEDGLGSGRCEKFSKVACLGKDFDMSGNSFDSLKMCKVYCLGIVLKR